MEDWLNNMGDWCISRKRYWGLPLPFWFCPDGHMTLVGSKQELLEVAVRGTEGLEELHRPWIDAVVIPCGTCGKEATRTTDVGDCWLDAGIVPFSTLGWRNETFVERGYAAGAGEGVTTADLPDHATWEQWFPADWISESREQIRLWFYSMSFMAVTLEGRSPYRRVLAYERVRDETGREMHKSTGNAIEANEAIERMGADVMRWIYSEQVPSQNVNFGYGPANDVKRRLLTLWNSVGFLVTYAGIEGFRPTYADLTRPSEEGLGALDRWLLARTRRLLREAEAGYERFWTPAVVDAFTRFVDDLSNWYIRRSRRRFYGYDEAAFRTLWYALVQSLRVISPLMPFLTEHLWRNLVADACGDAPASVHLAGWPEAAVVDGDGELLAEMEEARLVAELGRRARDASGLKLRQPVRRLVVQGARHAERHADVIRDELRVKELEWGEVEATELRVKPNLRVLGPKLGRELGAVRAALESGEFEELPGGGFRAAGHELGPDEVLVERIGREGWAVAAEDGVTVALDTALDDELRLEGRVLDLVHRLNVMRKDAGLAITDRIVVRLPDADADLLAHEDWIKEEVLAVGIEADGAAAEPQIARA
jgi:isoleucyl-tRNA synthetase